MLRPKRRRAAAIQGVAARDGELIVIVLDQTQVGAMNAHGERDYPFECCGLLIGRFLQDGSKEVVETFPISNAREEEAKRNRFLIRPEELLAGESEAMRKGLDVVGFYHSHPDDDAVPSGYDLDHAWPIYSYIIVSVREGSARDLRSWEMEADRSKFNPEELKRI
jgi:proteasome lid subunit RPN8/RPN11